jgi:hypothetical protein
MGFKSIFFLVVAVIVTSCQWGVPANKTKPAITKDTLVYTYKKIKERAPECGDKPDNGCTVATIVYPIFLGQRVLNDTVTRNLLAHFRLDEKHPDTSLKQLVHHFLKLYKNDKESSKRSDLIYQLDSKVSVVRQDSSLLTLQFEEYGYMGGAHGDLSTLFINWNTKANKKIELKDIFADGYSRDLNTVAENIFRKQEKLSDSASLTPGYLFKDGKFSLNNNFLITPIGIRFLYNQYEIKPYSAGQTNILIPYSQIRSLFRPNTVITQYIR